MTRKKQWQEYQNRHFKQEIQAIESTPLGKGKHEETHETSEGSREKLENTSTETTILEQDRNDQEMLTETYAHPCTYYENADPTIWKEDDRDTEEDSSDTDTDKGSCTITEESKGSIINEKTMTLMEDKRYKEQYKNDASSEDYSKRDEGVQDEVKNWESFKVETVHGESEASNDDTETAGPITHSEVNVTEVNNEVKSTRDKFNESRPTEDKPKYEDIEPIENNLADYYHEEAQRAADHPVTPAKVQLRESIRKEGKSMDKIQKIWKKLYGRELVTKGTVT